MKKVKKNSFRHSRIYNGILLGFIICSLIGISIHYIKPSFAYSTTIGVSNTKPSITVVDSSSRLIAAHKPIKFELKFNNVKDKKMYWYHKSGNIVTINSKTGSITGNIPGEATIYAYNSSSKITVTMKVYVECYLRLKSTSISMAIGSHANIGSEFKCVRNGYKLQYTSSNSKVASVSADGKVTALKKGTTTITVRVRNTNIYRTLTIKVKI